MVPIYLRTCETCATPDQNAKSWGERNIWNSIEEASHEGAAAESGRALCLCTSRLQPQEIPCLRSFARRVIGSEATFHSLEEEL